MIPSEHAVYVLYRNGAPYDGRRAAYYTRGQANAAVTRACDDIAGWRASNEAKAAVREQFTVEAYVRTEATAK